MWEWLGVLEEYLRIMENEKHPGHNDMKAWTGNQKERKLSPEKINQRILLFEIVLLLLEHKEI